MSIAPDPSPEADAWEQFTRSLILERFGKTCPELPREERARIAAEAAARNAILNERYGESGPALRAV